MKNQKLAQKIDENLNTVENIIDELVNEIELLESNSAKRENEINLIILDYKSQIDFLKDQLKQFEPASIKQSTAADSILKDVKFSESDIKDKERLEKMIEKEALGIYNSATGRHGRDLDTIKFFVRQGKVAELFLIENYGYEESDRKYHDLKDDNGDYTEVKAYNIRDKNAPSVSHDLKRIKNENWNVSKWYVLFQCTEGQYRFLDKIQIR